MDVPDPDIIKSSVAPPRGERGLKYLVNYLVGKRSGESLPLAGSVD